MSEEESPGAEGEESPVAGPVEEVAAPVPDTTTKEPVDTTTSGARMMMHHPWLAAAAVAVYATKVMWVKLRELGLAKQKKRLKNQQANKLKPIQDGEENGVESEGESDAEVEFDAETDEADLSLKLPSKWITNACDLSWKGS